MRHAMVMSMAVTQKNWNGQPADPARGAWYWLARHDGENLRHTAWYWCDQCRQWEAEPELAFSADQVQADGWRILGETTPPGP